MSLADVGRWPIRPKCKAPRCAGSPVHVLHFGVCPSRFEAAGTLVAGQQLVTVILTT